MAKSKKTEEKRGRGRPASFPNTDTVALLARIPVATREQLRQVAERREEPINVTLNRFIEQGFKNATRSRKSS